ncbi:hypothetical protein PG984_013842 [Apiospora sp. TS-2023a]
MDPNNNKNNNNKNNNNNNGGRVPRTDGINYNGKHPFRGVLEQDGQVYCLDCRESSNHAHRGMKNTQKDIGSHISKHRPNSAYQRDQARDPAHEWRCDCTFKAQSWHTFLAHIRGSHEFKGDSSHVQQSQVVPHYTKGVTPNGATVEEKKKQKQDEKEKASRPEATPYWKRDQYYQGGNGRGGDGGGMAC